ncbi:MAG: 1,2-phenylacetyl-CoA epoxidase subunit PaaC [Lautropia sp.]
MTASIKPATHPDVRYLLRVGDTCLVLAQRLAEWCGHAPILEEDIALTNMSLDLVGQARGVLTRAGARDAELGGTGFDEDQLAFLRDERDYLNCTIAELPRGDFAFTVLRNAMLATWLRLLWDRLQTSRDAELAAIAGKAVKEARYHQRHAADWVARLGDGTDASRARMDAALAELWRFVPELFESDEVDAAAARSGLGPAPDALRDAWFAQMQAILARGGMALPEAQSAFRSHGKRGVHTEHMGFLLAEMQTLQRSFPGGVW